MDLADLVSNFTLGPSLSLEELACLEVQFAQRRLEEKLSRCGYNNLRVSLHTEFRV